jgi:hypothetical protein
MKIKSFNKYLFRFLIIFNLFISGFVFALPGVSDYLPTEAGQYVYYKDFSFKDETYIGFLQYDDATFSARFFSPKTSSGSINVLIVFTVDSTKDKLELTGENIIQSSGSADVSTEVNYLHDLLYELTARRKKIPSECLKQNYRTSDIYAQFGGEVTLIWDYKIPVFNLSKIQNTAGNILLQAVCLNAITNSDDKGFENFSGFPSVPELPEKTKFNQKKLDKQWKAASDNMWLLNSDALVFTSETSLSLDFFADKSFSLDDYFSRIYLFSSEGNYGFLPLSEIKHINNSLVVSTMQYSIQNQKWTKDIKIIKSKENSKYQISGITVFYDYYKKYSGYFDTIIKRITE